MVSSREAVRAVRATGAYRHALGSSTYLACRPARVFIFTTMGPRTNTSLSASSFAVNATINPPRYGSKAFSLLPRNKRAREADKDMSEKPQATDFDRLNIFDESAVPPTSVKTFLQDGICLTGGVRISGGSGALLVGGEAFVWRPWGEKKTLVNGKGQWEVGNDAFGLLGLVWPRPDLLILGVGPEIRPLSPETKRYIMALGMRIEVLDTRNAASQFNLLATERGVDDIAAALIPVGWVDGSGLE